MSSSDSAQSRRVVSSGSGGPVVWKPKPQPHKRYLDKLPFYKRYPRATILTGSILTFCFVWMGPIYNMLRTPPENYTPEMSMWPGELAKGKTYKQQWLEKQELIKKRSEEAKAAYEEAKKAKAQAKLEAKKAA
ncbi:unnamed protein product [Orchesella dallaii]|uniref:Uncharacterized protein n=1 Tax=Orchesella dallaii TaxID=48710 RepID=A0ABP1R3P0_9HEXA